MAGDRAGNTGCAIRSRRPTTRSNSHQGTIVAKNKRPKPVPKFANEAAERAFWEKNDSTAYLDWKKAQPAVIPNLKPSSAKAKQPKQPLRTQRRQSERTSANAFPEPAASADTHESRPAARRWGQNFPL